MLRYERFGFQGFRLRPRLGSFFAFAVEVVAVKKWLPPSQHWSYIDRTLSVGFQVEVARVIIPMHLTNCSALTKKSSLNWNRPYTDHPTEGNYSIKMKNLKKSVYYNNNPAA